MIKRENLKTLCRNQVNVIATYRSHRQKLLYILLLLICILFILMPQFFRHFHKERNRPTNYEKTDNFRMALRENLEKLHALQHIQLQKKAPIFKTKAYHSSNALKQSKVFQMRQHAPTRMYFSRLHKQYSLTDKSTTTFLERSNYASFANQSSHAPRVIAQRLAHPGYTIPQGEFIHAVLETAISSNLPGMIRAVIARPVYSYQDDRLLIPKGSRLIGQYSSQTVQGINRILVVWQRILLPNGISIQIDSPGSDTLGEAGFAASHVDTHFLQRFGEASLLSLLSAASANWGIGANDVDNASQRYRSILSKSFQSSAGRSLHHSASIKPTLHLSQGSRVIVFVARDLDFYSTIGAVHAH